MAPLGSPDDLTEEQKEALKKVKDRFAASDKLHRSFRERWNLYYGLSRNFVALKRRHAQASSANDRDAVVEEARRAFGEELFIPYIFTVIETNLPRILASDPSITVKPNNSKPETEAACEPVKRLFERDQKSMGYDRKLQETVRSGLRYGLGVQKMYWQKKYRSGDIVPNQSKPGYSFDSGKQVLVFEGPMAESVDIFNFFWDPVAYDLESASYVIHRTWRSFEYIEQKVNEGKQLRAEGKEGGWAELDLDKIKGTGSQNKRGEVWAGRYEASGMQDYQPEGNEMFEVWEYHDRNEVHTVLNCDLLVQSGPNPFLHGDFPFQIYRPTIVEHEFCGIGEAEPIAHLQFELNMMRGQRRDAASLALNRGYFYQEGALNPKTIKTGIGVFTPVRMPPSEAIFPMPFTDLPASGVSEEEALKSDIEMTTGISESSTGGGGEATATGTQLVQAAANQRIRQKAKNLHPDLLRPATAQQRELYRQNYTEEGQGQEIRVEADQMPSEYQGERTPTGYVFIQCGPRELNADIDVEPIDGSTESENLAQKHTDAVELTQAVIPFAEAVDPQKYLKWLLGQFGVDQPEEMLKPPGPPPEQGVIESVGEAMKAAGIPQPSIEQILHGALQLHQQATEPEGPPEGAAASNGSTPEPAATGG